MQATNGQKLEGAITAQRKSRCLERESGLEGFELSGRISKMTIIYGRGENLMLGTNYQVTTNGLTFALCTFTRFVKAKSRVKSG